MVDYRAGRGRAPISRPAPPNRTPWCNPVELAGARDPARDRRGSGADGLAQPLSGCTACARADLRLPGDPDGLINGAVFDVGYSEMVVIKGIHVLLAVRAPQAALPRHGGRWHTSPEVGSSGSRRSARVEMYAGACSPGADDSADATSCSRS